MSRQQVINKQKPADPAIAEAAIAALKALGLDQGQRIRFRLTEAGSWQYGTVNAVEQDGSLRLYVKNKARSILPSKCQIEERGPRGGVVWVPLTEE